MREINKLPATNDHELTPEHYSAGTLAERRPAGRTTSARQHDMTSPTARDEIIVPIFIIAIPVKK